MKTIEPFNPREQELNRIIGVELRVVDAYGTQREVAMFGGLDIVLPAGNWTMRPRFNVTVHTSRGDATTGTQDLPV